MAGSDAQVAMGIEGAGGQAHLYVVPRALGMVLMVPRLRMMRAAGHGQRLLEALHARGLTTLSLAAPALVEPALLGLAQRADLAGLRLGLWLDLDAAMLALALAARHPVRVGAVVSVDPQVLADAAVLAGVHAATLLMRLGTDDPQAVAQVQVMSRVMSRLHCSKRLEVVPLPARGAACNGAVEAVAQIAADWLATHLAGGRLL